MDLRTVTVASPCVDWCSKQGITNNSMILARTHEYYFYETNVHRRRYRHGKGYNSFIIIDYMVA